MDKVSTFSEAKLYWRLKDKRVWYSSQTFPLNYLTRIQYIKNISKRMRNVEVKMIGKLLIIGHKIPNLRGNFWSSKASINLRKKIR